MRTVALPSGERVAAFGLGGWKIGDERRSRAEEIATFQLGLELGATLIDTAEMYGDGRSEELIAEALQGRRDDAFLVSKVLPTNATRAQTLAACERSLRRLRTDRLDLYLLHWRGAVPLAETLEAFLQLKEAGKIRYFGVSNFDRDDLTEWCALTGGSQLATNQVLYNLAHRGIEWDLLPWQRERRIPTMAYSPLQEGKLARHPTLVEFAERHQRTPAQVALAWLLAKDDIIVIPKTSHRERLRENWQALEQPLTAAQLSELDKIFPPPKRARPLEMI